MKLHKLNIPVTTPITLPRVKDLKQYPPQYALNAYTLAHGAGVTVKDSQQQGYYGQVWSRTVADEGRLQTCGQQQDTPYSVGAAYIGVAPLIAHPRALGLGTATLHTPTSYAQPANNDLFPAHQQPTLAQTALPPTVLTYQGQLVTYPQSAVSPKLATTLNSALEQGQLPLVGSYHYPTHTQLDVNEHTLASTATMGTVTHPCYHYQGQDYVYVAAPQLSKTARKAKLTPKNWFRCEPISVTPTKAGALQCLNILFNSDCHAYAHYFLQNCLYPADYQRYYGHTPPVTTGYQPLRKPLSPQLSLDTQKLALGTFLNTVFVHDLEQSVQRQQRKTNHKSIVENSQIVL